MLSFSARDNAIDGCGLSGSAGQTSNSPPAAHQYRLLPTIAMHYFLAKHNIYYSFALLIVHQPL